MDDDDPPLCSCCIQTEQQPGIHLQLPAELAHRLGQLPAVLRLSLVLDGRPSLQRTPCVVWRFRQGFSVTGFPPLDAWAMGDYLVTAVELQAGNTLHVSCSAVAKGGEGAGQQATPDSSPQPGELSGDGCSPWQPGACSRAC
jgi:hypothetical protein